MPSESSPYDRMKTGSVWPGVIEAYREHLPVTDDTRVVTLLEGNTPLIPSVALPKRLGVDVNVLFKFEGLNPTGSFKDRGMTMAITKALEDGAEYAICASTGNTSASASAYAARCGMTSIVLIPQGKIAQGKLAQAVMHGALVIQVDGNFDDCLRLVVEVAEERPVAVVNSINPYRIQGQKTGAFEICDQLGHPPTYHALPVGNAGNITAYWKGYCEYLDAGRISSRPTMLGFQAAGSAPIVLGHPVENPETIATAIRIGNPASWETAEAARDESGGVIEPVTDEEITEAQIWLARNEGVFPEPASAASVAGVIKLAERGYFKAGDEIVCILTGHGLKDPDRAIAITEKPQQTNADVKAIFEIVDRARQERDASAK
jgi:threonine synthase